MAITVLQWCSHRQMSGLKRLITAPGHVSMILLFSDRSKANQDFAHTITWYSSDSSLFSGQQRTGSSAGMFGTNTRWYPKDIFAEMEYLGSRTTVEDWLDNNNHGWAHKYMEHLSNAQNMPFNKFLEKRVRPPDRQVSILTRSDADAYTGLFDANIRTWWLAFADRHKTYKLFSRSCAAVVGMALIEGGAEAFESKPHGIWTPDSVFGWAEKISKTVHKENESIRAAFETLTEEAKKFPNPGPLWTHSEWYRESEKGVTLLSRRYGLLKTIDSLLDIFHGIDNRMNITKEFKKQAKLNCLTLIVKGLSQILRERGSTKRRAAIGQLAAQAQATFRFIQNEERRVIEELRQRKQLLEEEDRKYNQTFNDRLEEISDLQFDLINRISELQNGKKITDGKSIEQLQFQLKLLEMEEEELKLKLR